MLGGLEHSLVVLVSATSLGSRPCTRSRIRTRSRRSRGGGRLVAGAVGPALGLPCGLARLVRLALLSSLLFLPAFFFCLSVFVPILQERLSTLLGAQEHVPDFLGQPYDGAVAGHLGFALH